MSPPALVIVLLSCVAACAESFGDSVRTSRRTRGSLSKEETPGGCMYEGRWYTAGASVRTREACLACVCAHGALSCRRRTCAPLTEPPPRCHIVHQRGECCPELQCPDGVKGMELGQSGRLDDRDIETPSSLGHACVEGGTVYAAGSAMSSSTACEQCFCLGGTRRCVRPVCLPPPPGCKARPAPGACCAQRYYCEHAVTKPPNERNPHDCITPEGKWAFEGERVKSAETAAKCIQCFCLRGSIRCQHLSCAPTLQGCSPLVQQGQCCPHQYQCGLHKNGTKIQNLNIKRMNTLTPTKDEVRSLHSSKSTKRETTLKELTTDKSTSAITKSEFGTTMKIKRNTEEQLVTDSKMNKSSLTTLHTEQTTQTLNDASTSSVVDDTTIEESLEATTEQPEGSVKIIINGTINCTAELSSTSLLMNVSNDNDTVWIKNEGQSRIPLVDNIENYTLSPNDIITDKNYDNYFDDNESFTINVTSSLRTNTTHTTTAATKSSSTVRPKTVPPALLGAANMSKVKKNEQDYDYTEATLPPSLPNLKIIPFVAADAVLDDEVSSKESVDYPILESNEKFPVYYPNDESPQSAYAMRKEDVYNPTQYPIFVSKKVEIQYPTLTQEMNSPKVNYPGTATDETHEYTVSASLGSSSKVNHNIEEKSPVVNNKFEINAETPAVNLFSPPVETEGGFVPKDLGIDEYYSVYQSTPPPPVMHHLTTSMQLEPKDECVSSDGRHLSEGESISLACSVCTCSWGELRCSPRVCSTPPGCTRRSATLSTSDLCCGELICDKYNHTTAISFFSPPKFALTLNESKVPQNDNNDIPIQHQSTVTSSTTVMPNYNNSDPGNEFSDIAMKELVTTSELTNLTKPIVTNRPQYTESSTEHFEVAQNNNHSVEYEDEDDDEGFSLGSVLQLLLSETYETTTTSPPTRKTTTTTQPPKYFTNSPVSTNKDKLTTSDEITDDAFVPVTHRFPIIPPKKIYPHAVNRIDHLILGESNSIRKTTQRPVTVFKPIPYPTTRKTITSAKTTPRPLTTKSVEITSKEGFSGQSVEVRPPSQHYLPGMNLGLPKLAGCNIYGRMYRVGRIIAELSSPCQECKCTELGVQCRSLSC